MSSTAATRDREDDPNQRVFKNLPKLGSAEYMELLRTAPASALPAPVLVMAYRQLPPGSTAAEATLSRLLTTQATNGYLRPLRVWAARKVAERDWFTVDDLVVDTVALIARALNGPNGAGAERHWNSFVRQRMVDAHRELVGRREERRQPRRSSRGSGSAGGYEIDPADELEAHHAPWHGRLASDHEQWLEEFIARTVARISNERIRAVAQDLFSADPSPISGAPQNGKIPLTVRFNVDRSTIYAWRQIARTRLLAALHKQDEREVELGWLEEAIVKRRGAKGNGESRPDDG